MTGIPKVVTTIQNMFKTLGATGSWVTLAISALVGLISVMAQWQKESDEKHDLAKQMERTKKEIEALDAAAEKAKKSLDELTNA
jgi:hypothetical protein